MLVLNVKISWYVSFDGGEQWENCLPARGKIQSFRTKQRRKEFLDDTKETLAQWIERRDARFLEKKINFYATMWSVAANDEEDTEDKGRVKNEEKEKNTTKMKQSQR